MDRRCAPARAFRQSRLLALMRRNGEKTTTIQAAKFKTTDDLEPRLRHLSLKLPTSQVEEAFKISSKGLHIEKKKCLGGNAMASKNS